MSGRSLASKTRRGAVGLRAVRRPEFSPVQPVRSLPERWLGVALVHLQDARRAALKPESAIR